MILQNGLYIDDISLPNLKIKQLYIKWDEKLNISIKETKITKQKNSSGLKLNNKDIYKIIQDVHHFHNFFEKIIIEKIVFNDIAGSFKYVDGNNGYIIANSPEMSLKSTLVFKPETINIKIDKFHDSKRDIKLNGNIVLDAASNDATASISINIHNDISLKILANANKEKFFYRINSQKNIKSITHTMELLNLHEGVKYWAYKAIDFSSVSIKSIYGWGEFNKLDSAYENLYARAVGHDLSYRYNKNLDSIHTKSTIVEFKNGVLYIRPQQHYTYSSNLGKSWLKIDFTKKEELLTLYLIFDGKLDKETLGVLKQYEINVPFLQNTGVTKTNLTLKVNLRTVEVDAKGDFFTKKANFRYQGFDIDIFGAYILLDNYDVKINQMLAKYQDMATTDVNVKFNAKRKAGTIDFNIKKMDFKEIGVSLNRKKTPLKVKYTLSAKQDKIAINSSSWSIYNNIVNIDKIVLPFNLDTLRINIPSTLISSQNKLSAYVSGIADFKKINFDLDIDLQRSQFGNIELTQPKTPLKLKYDKTLSLSSNKTIKFKVGSIESFLGKTDIEFKNRAISLKDSYINIGNIFKTKFKAQYSMDSKSGYIDTKNIKFYNNEFEEIYSSKNKNDFNIYISDNNLYLDSKKLKTSLLYNSDLLKISIDSISPIAKNSKLLQKYKVTNGTFYLSKKNNDKYIYFNSKIKYPYKVLVKDNLEIEDYSIRGKINSESKKTSLKINENVDVKIDKDIDVSMKDIGINISAIVNIINDLDGNSSKPNNTNIAVQAKDSYLYIGKDRRIISEEMYLQYYKKVLTAQLKYKNGLADLKYEKNKFYAYGEDFNDKFMENLFSLSRFKGGHFEFRISGSPNKYDGIFTVNDTIIIDYKILNNILAFVNTIPSLVTFAIPGYSSKGLKAKRAYMKFSSENDIFNISDIYLDSKEIDILGHGEVSFKSNTADLELNLKTDIGSKLSKVPLVGYLLMGKDSISTTLSITGALNNPNVESLLAKDIAVAPLNILIRALTLPYYLIKGDDSNSTKED